MKNKTRFFHTTFVVATMLIMVIIAGPSAYSSSQARKEVKPHSQTSQKVKETKTVNIKNANFFISLEPGSVFKGRNSRALYYLDEDGSRRVFPNEATYRSWYDDFNNVIEVDDAQLAEYPLTGNVRYKPGSFLVKIQTDPKVYAVDHNGILRWIKTEKLARDLYGGNWNKLIDDIPAAFFINYRIGELVDEISDFDPVLAEEIETINENIKAKIKEKIQEKISDKRMRYCKNLEKHLDKLQRRLAVWDLELENLDDNFIDKCMEGFVDDDDDEDEDDDDDDYWVGKKVKVCHIPPGDPEAAHTIIVSKNAAKAHIMHGDYYGECEGDDDDDDEEPTDTTAPVITDKTAIPAATSTVVTWTTDEDSTSVVEYATSSLSAASTTETVSDSTLVTSHSITLENLESETTYYYIVKSEDVAGNLATSTEMTFTTDEIIIPDTTAPVISGISSTPSSTTALIAWTTDEAANSRIEYATSSLASATSTLELVDSTFVTSHSFELSDLATSTLYYFIVESADAATNLATSTEQTFTTL